MKWTLAAIVAATVMVGSSALRAQAPAGSSTASPLKPPPPGGPSAECLTPEQKANNQELQDLANPTQGKGEPNWIFDPDYFLGIWTFKQHVPDTPLSTGGEVVGRLTWTHVEGCVYDGQVEATGPEGPIKETIRIIYSAESNYLTWIETDARGFALHKSGRIGGDLGKQFHHHWEVPVFLYKGQTLRWKGDTFFQASSHYIIRPMLSIDGEPYMSTGVLHFYREGTEPSR